MIISLHWLNEFVDVADYFNKPENLAEILTKAGLEVENIVDQAKPYRFVVTGLILEKDKHPNADKLSVCRVTTGEGVVHQIVCGAQNHQAQDRVVVALPGAVLPGDFKISQSVIRSVDSGGMLCSLKELGQVGESSGIVILPPDAQVGQSYSEYAGLNDVTFELKVTPNRADCLSHFGLAREVACLLARPLRQPSSDLKVGSLSTRSMIEVEVESTQDCPRYTGRGLRGVRVAPSPKWLQRRLTTLGLRSINNVVDVTNLVMMELGQPLHAFDAQQIQGQALKVGLAGPGERFQSLDGTELDLKGTELVIRDAKRVVALAGVVGGLNSGVTDTTTDLFLEAAYFTPASVRKSSRAHGLTTDSAYRFSRGVDPQMTLQALDRATYLLHELAGGEICNEPYDFYPQPLRSSSIMISLQTVTDRLGFAADATRFVDLMQRLGCVVQAQSENAWSVTPPSFRFDLETDMDLVEEYARLVGYDQIPETLPVGHVVPASHDEVYLQNQKVSLALRALGFRQAVNLAMANPKVERQNFGPWGPWQQAGLSISEQPVKLLNPLSEDGAILRQTLSSSLLRNASDNVRQGNEVGQLFEIGKTFCTTGPGEYQEYWRLALICWGASGGLWQNKQDAPLVLQLKARIEQLLTDLKQKSWRWQEAVAERKLSFLHTGQQVILDVQGQSAGWLGTLHPGLAESLKFREVPVVLAEFDLPALALNWRKPIQFHSVVPFPIVQRDLALVMEDRLPVGEVQAALKKSLGALAIAVSVVDLFTGELIGVGRKSVTYRVFFQDPRGTLQEDVVSAALAQAIPQLEAKFNLNMR